MILITGSRGLIGTAIGGLLSDAGVAWRPFDVRDDAAQDTRIRDSLLRALDGVTGVIHLAAVSRVVWAECEPAKARAVNVDALQTLLELMGPGRSAPWLIFASSREVYGEQETLPVREDAELRPLNTYARSKVEGERLVSAAAEQGMLAQIVRFSNVYGSTDDHEDRVVPAFARAAATGGTVRVEGGANMFDFTHVSDAARGLMALYEATVAGEALPAIHFLTGAGTTLDQLARMAGSHSQGAVQITDAPARKFDVSRFVGDPSRARALLGWTPQVELEAGFGALVQLFAELSRQESGKSEAGQDQRCAS